MCATKLNIILFKSARKSQNSQLLNTIISIFIAQNKTMNVKKMDRKKFNPLSQAWLWLCHRFSQNTQSLTIIMKIFSVKIFTPVGQQIWKFWVDTRVRLLAWLICAKFTDAAQIFCKQKIPIQNFIRIRQKCEPFVLTDTVTQTDRVVQQACTWLGCEPFVLTDTVSQRNRQTEWCDKHAHG